MCRRECPRCGGGTGPWPVRMPEGNRALLRGKEKTWGERSLVISCIYVKSFPIEERLFSFFSLLRFKTRWVGGRRWSGLRKAGFQLSQTLQALGREDYRWGFDHGFDVHWGSLLRKCSTAEMKVTLSFEEWRHLGCRLEVSQEVIQGAERAAW